jgi:Holliday junction DNA helicase RuvA
MIGKLAGMVDSLAEDHAIIDVHGVGYLVYCPVSTLSRLSVGSSAILMVETRVGGNGSGCFRPCRTSVRV